MDRESILDTLKNSKSYFFESYPIASLALFGSFARGCHNEHSDVDLLVQFNQSVGSRFIDLANELESTLGRKVDLVSANGIKKKYYYEIVSDLVYV